MPETSAYTGQTSAILGVVPVEGHQSPSVSRERWFTSQTNQSISSSSQAPRWNSAQVPNHTLIREYALEQHSSSCEWLSIFINFLRLGKRIIKQGRDRSQKGSRRGVNMYSPSCRVQQAGLLLVTPQSQAHSWHSGREQPKIYSQTGLTSRLSLYVPAGRPCMWCWTALSLSSFVCK